MINKVTLLGRVGKDPEVRYLEGGTAIARFSLATSRKWKDKEGKPKELTQWHKITLWQRLAEIAEKYVSKGDMLYVEGEIQYNTYENKDGVKSYFTEIVASELKMLSGKKEEKPKSAAGDEYTEKLMPKKQDDLPTDEDDLPF